MNDKQFRFQDMEIWKRAADFSPALFVWDDELDKRRLFRFAEQLRGATLSKDLMCRAGLSAAALLLLPPNVVFYGDGP